MIYTSSLSPQLCGQSSLVRKEKKKRVLGAAERANVWMCFSKNVKLLFLPKLSLWQGDDDNV